MKKGHYVYQYLHPEYGHLYCGRTENLDERIFRHNNMDTDNISREYENLLKESVVMYVELQNKAQEIAVEAYCIDRFKPFLNKAFKYDSDEFILEMKLPKWKLYKKRKGRTTPINGRYVQKDMDGNIVGVYNTLKEIKEFYPDIKQSGLNMNITGKIKSYYGYKWTQVKNKK